MSNTDTGSLTGSLPASRLDRLAPGNRVPSGTQLGQRPGRIRPPAGPVLVERRLRIHHVLQRPLAGRPERPRVVVRVDAERDGLRELVLVFPRPLGAVRRDPDVQEVVDRSRGRAAFARGSSRCSGSNRRRRPSPAPTGGARRTAVRGTRRRGSAPVTTWRAEGTIGRGEAQDRAVGRHRPLHRDPVRHEIQRRGPPDRRPRSRGTRPRSGRPTAPEGRSARPERSAASMDDIRP
jgi:hypothetical protein